MNKTEQKKAFALIAAALVVVFMSYFGYAYLVRAVRGLTTPNLAMWLLFSVGVSLTMWTNYVHERRYQETGAVGRAEILVTSAGNTVDVVMVWAIFLAILLAAPKVRRTFTLFEISCLIAAGLILVFWRWNLWRARHHPGVAKKATQRANESLQVIMSIAYLPLFDELWHATSHGEPLDKWAVAWVGSALALIPPALNQKRLPFLYAIRALVLVSLNIALMLRIDFF